MKTLPVDVLEGDVLASLARDGRVVVTSPTGSGKSTQVPRWLARGRRVLVVEPRRVACRSLAQRVAELERTPLGDGVGYHVRDDRRCNDSTRIVFATPGIVLRLAAGADPLPFSTVVLDEFHERSLDVDLLLALLLEGFEGGLAVMSATLDGDRVARHVGGPHLHAEGRVFPVERRYLAGQALLPDIRGLEDRLLAALDACDDAPGDVLVFLPGKGEIAAAERALSLRRDLDLVPLHGGLSLEQQGRAFSPSSRRKVILATNVAETSVTLPGVGVVIDSGLVRRTRYHDGRGFLTLVPVAKDSAAQRAGRAGRTAAGLCIRLWSEAACLDPVTPPEVHRESLVPLLLAVCACGARVTELPFFDAPKDHAVQAARAELQALGALDDDDRLTERGRRIFGLPLDAHLGRLLVEAEVSGCLEDAVDLVAALSVDRPLFERGPRPADPADDLRADGCDAVALIRAVRAGQPRRHRLHPWALEEARSVARRLRHAWGLPRRRDPTTPIDRKRLALMTLRADTRSAHVARRRKRAVKWSHGGTEIELGKESAVQGDEVDTIAVLATRALGVGQRDTTILATCAMPVPVAWLLEAGLGRDRLAGAVIVGGRVVARVERVYARRVLATREETPTGPLARAAIAERIVSGALFPAAWATTCDRIEAATLWERLRSAGRAGPDAPAWPGAEGPIPPPEEWLGGRIEALGVESGDDLALLSEADLVAPDLPAAARARIDREYPREVDVGDARYRVSYDLERLAVPLEKVQGQRKAMPPLDFLPAFTGFRILVKDRSNLRVLRG